MPAYFNISLQFKREDIYSNFMNDFYAALDNTGLKFQSGFYEETEISQKQIAAWNQQRIEQNLGFAEFSQDYKQSCFHFGNYTKVRGFWLNNYPEDNVFSYEIIIPESDVLTQQDGVIFQRKKAEQLLTLSQKIWQFYYVKTIQTGLESNDESIALSDIEKGKYPNITPFAIVEKKNIQFVSSPYYVNESFEKRDGILLMKYDSIN